MAYSRFAVEVVKLLPCGYILKLLSEILVSGFWICYASYRVWYWWLILLVASGDNEKGSRNLDRMLKLNGNLHTRSKWVINENENILIVSYAGLQLVCTKCLEMQISKFLSYAMT